MFTQSPWGEFEIRVGGKTVRGTEGCEGKSRWFLQSITLSERLLTQDTNRSKQKQKTLFSCTKLQLHTCRQTFHRDKTLHTHPPILTAGTNMNSFKCQIIVLIGSIAFFLHPEQCNCHLQLELVSDSFHRLKRHLP